MIEFILNKVAITGGRGTRGLEEDYLVTHTIEWNSRTELLCFKDLLAILKATLTESPLTSRYIDFALDTFLPDSTVGLKAFEAQQPNAPGSPHFAIATFIFHATNVTSGILVAYFPAFTLCTKILHLLFPIGITKVTNIIPDSAPHLARNTHVFSIRMLVTIDLRYLMYFGFATIVFAKFLC
jgi:hypothetical protein